MRHLTKTKNVGSRIFVEPYGSPVYQLDDLCCPKVNGNFLVVHFVTNEEITNIYVSGSLFHSDCTHVVLIQDIIFDSRTLSFCKHSRS